VADFKRANLRSKWSTTPKAGWSLCYVSTINSNRQTIFVADAHRDDGKRFVVRADEKLTTVLELEAAIRKNSIDAVCRRLAESRSR
jgi:hypothetical protein